MSERFAYHVSIGENCVPATRLAMAGVRAESYPFDWAASNLDEVGRFVDLGADAWFAGGGNAPRAPGSDPPHANPDMHWPPHDTGRDEDATRAYVGRCWRRLCAAMEDACARQVPVLLLHYVPYERPLAAAALDAAVAAFRRRWPTLRFEVLSCTTTLHGHLSEENVSDGTALLDGDVLLRVAAFQLTQPWREETGGWAGQRNDALWAELFRNVGVS